MSKQSAKDDDSYIEPSGNLDVVTADDFSILLQDDLSTINLYEEVHATQSSNADTDMNYLKSFKILRLAVKIPTKKLRILNGLLSESLVYLKDNQRLFLYGKSEHQEKPKSLKTFASKKSVFKTVRDTEIYLMPEKEFLPGEDVTFHGKLVDLTTNEGIPNERVWLAIDNDQIIGVTRADKDGNFQYKVSGDITAKGRTLIAMSPNIGESQEVFFRIQSV